jgi:hypothetical protein
VFVGMDHGCGLGLGNEEARRGMNRAGCLELVTGGEVPWSIYYDTVEEVIAQATGSSIEYHYNRLTGLPNWAGEDYPFGQGLLFRSRRRCRHPRHALALATGRAASRHATRRIAAGGCHVPGRASAVVSLPAERPEASRKTVRLPFPATLLGSALPAERPLASRYADMTT